MVDKQILRKVYLEKRLFLSNKEFEERNLLIKYRLLDFLDSLTFEVIHTFLPIKKKKEINTLTIIDELRIKNPKTTFYISRTLEEGRLEHYQLDEFTALEENKWGIPEPVNAKLVNVENMEVVLVPLITFDKKGHRIGYGKGYYDRFLEKYPDVLKIGLALGPPLDTIAYVEPTDIKLDWCISPFEVYRFC